MAEGLPPPLSEGFPLPLGEGLPSPLGEGLEPSASKRTATVLANPNAAQAQNLAKWTSCLTGRGARAQQPSLAPAPRPTT